MPNSRTQSSIGFARMAGVAILAGSALFGGHCARAEIILDNFDEPFEIALPPSGAPSSPPLTQLDVGPLGVQRDTIASAFFSKPNGRVDANVSRASSLTYEFDRVNPTSATSSPIVALNLLYLFDSLDAGERGMNDRVIVDFAYLRSAIPVARVTVAMHDPRTNYVSQLFDIPSHDGPFSLEFPFHSFGERGGGGSVIDPARIHTLYLTITPVYFADNDRIDFSTAVEWIRFAGAIPEPTTSADAFVGAFAACLLAFTRSKWTFLRMAPPLLSALFVCSSARAEIILDDFDDPFEISLPQVGTSSTTVQSGVGPMAAARESSFVNILARPTGRIDASNSEASALTFELDKVHPTSSEAPIVALNVNYFFDETDVTQRRDNDRVIVDFAYLRSAIPLARVDVFMHDRQSNYVSQLFNIAPEEASFSLQLQFEAFSERGGGGGRFDPTHAHSLYFSIIPVYFTNIEMIEFSTVVERIRFGGPLPEPKTKTVACVGAFSAFLMLCRKRRKEPCRTVESHLGQGCCPY